MSGGDVPRKVHDPQAVAAALATLDAGGSPEPEVLRPAVQHLLGALAELVPGRSVEVRVPPFGAVQCGSTREGGSAHRRGTPPNVIEMSPVTWLQLATGRRTWQQALSAGDLYVSGIRADLSGHLPLNKDSYA